MKVKFIPIKFFIFQKDNFDKMLILSPNIMRKSANMQKYKNLYIYALHLFNRPGAAGAVLQSPPSLINSVTDPLGRISSKHC